MTNRIVTLSIIAMAALCGCGSEEDGSSPQKSPSALCNDGTYSYSQNCSGTCSGHGGVAQWMGILYGCGGGTPSQPAVNDMPSITISNVSPTILPVATSAPFKKTISFSITASDAGKNMNYLECGPYKQDGTYYFGGRDFSSFGTATTLQISLFTIDMNTEFAGTFNLKCTITDTKNNKASAIKTITVQ